jgi:hypothetical protein
MAEENLKGSFENERLLAMWNCGLLTYERMSLNEFSLPYERCLCQGCVVVHEIDFWKEARRKYVAFEVEVL